MHPHGRAADQTENKSDSLVLELIAKRSHSCTGIRQSLTPAWMGPTFFNANFRRRLTIALDTSAGEVMHIHVGVGVS